MKQWKQLKNLISRFIFVGLAILFVQPTEAGLLHTYNELTLKNLEQMTRLVRGKIAEAKKSKSGQTVPLKEGLQAVFSRPNEDGMIEKVMPALKSELDHLKAYEKTVESLVQEALDALNNPMNFKAQAQVTYLLLLENTIAQLRPGLQEGSFEKRIIEKISQAEVVLSKEARSERKLRLMREARSPSEIAKEVLQKKFDQQAEPKSSPDNAPVLESEKVPEVNPK